MPNISQEQIESLLSELQTGLNDVLAKSTTADAAKAGEALAKAHPGEETKDEKAPDVSATSDGPKDDKSAAPKDDHSAEKPADNSADPAASASPTDAPAPGTPGMEDSMDPAAEDSGPIDPVKLHEEYSKLSPEDLKAHYIACKAALFEIVGSGDGDCDADDASAAPGADMSAGPAGGSPPPASPPAPDAPPTMKGEKDMSGGANGGEHLKVMKSELDIKIENLQKELADRDDALGKLAKAMETVLTTPVRKSVTAMADLPKSATKPVTELSREEVRAKLKDKVSEGKLNKSELDLVVNFDLGKVKVQDVAHLLESKAS